jgi:acyl carrier protein
MDNSAIMDKLIEGIMAINVTIKREGISRDRGLVEAGVLDSYGFVEFISYIEEAFGLAVSDSEINQSNFKNLETICEMIDSKQS